MKQEIITYLAGPRNFIQGVELYEKYGINRNVKESHSAGREKRKR